jgi:GMP synthase (glutamine-hydrolysing)
MTSHSTILIIDFGSQVTQLIARRVREAGVYSEIVPFHSAEEALERIRPQGIILSGGPASVTDMTTPRAPEARAWQKPVPIVFLGRAVIDKTVDCFMTDAHASFVVRQPAGNLFR